MILQLYQQFQRCKLIIKPIDNNFKLFTDIFTNEKLQLLYKIFKQKLSTNTLKLNSSPHNVMYVFDRKCKFLQRERAAQALDVNNYDYIKDEIGYRLSDRVFDIKRKFNKMLDLGCGRGHVSKCISNESVYEIILSDLSPTWLEQAKCTDGIKFDKQVHDEEIFSLASNSLDFIISCLSLHWINDLPGLFNRIINSLKEDGVFMAAIFGTDTLYELRGSLLLAELERDGGIAPHISPFTTIRDIGTLLTNAGFSLLTIDTEELVIRFPSMFELLRDLKGMGENNAIWNRQLHFKRNTLFAAAAIYDQLYGKIKEEYKSERYIPATFQIIYLIGWKPHKSQPKPSKRGMGQISLKDISRIDEIIKKNKFI